MGTLGMYPPAWTVSVLAPARRWSDRRVNDDELWRAYNWPEHCLRANFVMSVDGHIQGSDGRSGTLSGPEDRRRFHMLRAGCDAVLVGAGTARTEGYGPVQVKAQWRGLRLQPDPPVLVMVTASGNVPEVEGAVVVGGDDLAEVKRQYPRILCEGGPRLFTTLLEQGLVDELALSIGGRLGGSGLLLTEAVTATATALHADATAEGVFTLWGIR